MNRTKIEWADYTFNPVVGCYGPDGTKEKPNNCKYCYAKRIAKRFFKDNPDFEPRFYPERLKEPYWVKKPSKIFVCSMADLFGDWVSSFWIDDILEVVRNNPRHTFQFLTKNPKRYLEFDFPENCWLGATIESEDFFYRKGFLGIKKIKNNNYTFVSIEPILGEFSPIFFQNLDLVIVGAMTGPNAIVPKKEWIKSIKHPNIFWKNNIKKYLKGAIA